MTSGCSSTRSDDLHQRWTRSRRLPRFVPSLLAFSLSSRSYRLTQPHLIPLKFISCGLRNNSPLLSLRRRDLLRCDPGPLRRSRAVESRLGHVDGLPSTSHPRQRSGLEGRAGVERVSLSLMLRISGKRKEGITELIGLACLLALSQMVHVDTFPHDGR
jgi:hypothetical protein